MSRPALQELAPKLAALPLEGLRRPFPYKLEHVVFSEREVKLPSELHPAFYGCFDWHSAVHGHWTLVRLLKCCPNTLPTADIRTILEQNLSSDNLKVEANYLAQAGRPSFERPYGWAWLLKLAEELHTWDDPLGVRLSKNLRPLVQTVITRYLDFFPKQSYPIRSGVHSDTAFGLTLALDYARATRLKALETMVVERAQSYYGSDRDYPACWEPGGDQFLSPALTVADLMRRVLGGADFTTWLSRFLPRLGEGEPKQLLVPVEVSYRKDPKIVHLDGLNLSRAWAMSAVARALPSNDERQELLLRSADAHAQAALDHVFSGSYEGEHWLATFAVYLLSQEF